MSIDRRTFLTAAGACAAHLALATRGLGAADIARMFRPGATGRPLGRVVADEPWGRLVEVGPGVWALVSTPLEDRTTLCNGGIVAGRSGVAIVEAFASPEGAAWMARRARELTGRWPDRVIVTHYHGDHTGGLAGFGGEGRTAPDLVGNRVTRDLADRTAAERGQAADTPLRAALAELRSTWGPGQLYDLGGRTLRVMPLEGHTASDLALVVDEPSVVFCGDLVWNGMFPNYVDARPSRLDASVAALARVGGDDSVWVPGHGDLADRAAIERYRALLSFIEGAARTALERGMSAARAAEVFRLPAELGEWYRFSPSYPERALSAWMAELGGPGDSTP